MKVLPITVRIRQLTMLAAVASFSGFLAGIFAGPAAAQSPPPLDESSLPEIVARVEGVPVTRAELLTQARLVRAQALQATGVDPASDPVFFQGILDGLIGELLFYADSRKRGVAASPAEVDQAVAAMEARFPSAADFDEALGQQGTDRQEIRRQVEQSLSIEKVIRAEIAPKIEIDEKERQAFYAANRDQMTMPERVRLRHVLLRVPPGASGEEKAAIRAKIDALQSRLAGGDDFATIARQYSEDSESKELGGDLGWLAASDPPSAIDRAVAMLEPGQLSGVVESGAGYHIVELLERKRAQVRAFAEVSEQIGEYLRDLEIQREVGRRVEALRQQAKVEILI